MKQVTVLNQLPVSDFQSIRENPTSHERERTVLSRPPPPPSLPPSFQSNEANGPGNDTFDEPRCRSLLLVDRVICLSRIIDRPLREERERERTMEGQGRGVQRVMELAASARGVNERVAIM